VHFGYLGRFVAIKGVLDLARAVASLPRAVPFRLEVRAPIDDASELRQRFDAIVGGDDRVTFAPAIRPEEVPDVLACYDVVCAPSRCFENGPTVLSESFGAGTPVIGTRIGAMPELITDGVNGALVEPGDWKALAGLLERVATHPETVDGWRRALPRARTMDAIAEDYEKLYAQILDVHP
jgi:glycosyltransferase involved in cell wall biosynthesis